MRSLYDILESILDTDENIIRSTELYTRYEIFLQYFGDILWKKSPYSYSPGVGTIVFEFDELIQNGSATHLYSEVDVRLIRYFKHLKRTYNKTYKISWTSKYVTAGIIYYLNMKKGSKNNVIEFRVRNIRDNRRIDIVWPKNFVFMSPDTNEDIKSRFTRREIDESILDDDITIKGRVEEVSIISQLIDNGILYACERTKTSVELARQNEIASFKNGELSFFNDKAQVSSEVVIWYDRAKDFLKKLHIKSISAPQITIVFPQDDLSMFGTLKTRYIRIYEPNSKTLKNLKTEEGRSVDYLVVKNMDFSYRQGGAVFNDPRHSFIISDSIIRISTYDNLIFQNCTLNLDRIVYNGEDIDFKNCVGEVHNIEVYDPSLFDSDFGKKLFKIFDDKYEIIHYKGVKQEFRKTNSIRKVLAYFGNELYTKPNKSPYKIDGELKSIVNLSGFNHFSYIMYADNRYEVIFTQDKSIAERLQRIERVKYTTSTNTLTPIEKTKDDYYCIIIKRTD